MRSKLNAVKVKLLEWKCPEVNTLKLYFEKVPTYLIQRNFDKKKDSVFTDFGYLEIQLTINDKAKIITHSLDDYINDEDIFIEEDVTNRLTFWNGEYVERYDWSSSYDIDFDDIKIVSTPLSADEWKAKYINMTLDFSEIYFEEWDKLELKFFNLFRGVVEGMMSSWPNDAGQYKDLLMQRLNDIPHSIRQRNVDYQNAKEEFYQKNRKENKVQQEVNKNIFGFWES